MLKSREEPASLKLDSSHVDTFLAAILRGEMVDARLLAGADLQPFMDRAHAHDVMALVADQLSAQVDVPDEMRACLADEANRAVAADLVREVELRRFLHEVSKRDIGVLVVKGSHLAYSHYARPDLRARIDSDVLIPPGARGVVHDILIRELGYSVSSKVSGELMQTQKLYAKYGYDADTPVHILDVHWRLASPQVFANVLTYDEVASSAVGLPRLAPGARGPSDVHALLIACMHRVAHHPDEFSLKWLYDVHLIASRLSEDAWRQFVGLAIERRVAAVSWHSLMQSERWFRTSIPEFARADTRFTAPPEELSARYLAPRHQAAALLDDLRALSTWRERTRLVREHLFPSEQYMRQMYAPGSSAPLPALYVLRLVRGFKKWTVEDS